MVSRKHGEEQKCENHRWSYGEYEARNGEDGSLVIEVTRECADCTEFETCKLRPEKKEEFESKLEEWEQKEDSDPNVDAVVVHARETDGIDAEVVIEVYTKDQNGPEPKITEGGFYFRA